MRLWLALTLTVNSIVLTAFLAYGSFIAYEQSDFQGRSIKRNADNIAASIAAGSANDLLTASYDRLEDRLLRQVHIGSVEELVIADTGGRILSQTRRDAAGNPEAVYDKLGSAIDLKRTTQETDRQYIHLVPIERGSLLGWVRITASLDELTETRRHIWKDTLWATLVTLLLVAAILALTLRQASRLLERASLFAANLVNQRGSTLATDSRIHEIAQLKTALNEASQALAAQFRAQQESEARKGAVQESSLDALITIDSDGRIVDFNPAAETTFGYRCDEVKGQVMSEVIVPPAHREAHEHGMRHYRATGEGPVLRKRIEISAIRRDGSEFPIELSIVPFVVGEDEYFLGSVRDISERKALEAEQKRVTEVLHQTLGDLANQQFALDEHAIVSIADLQGNIVYVNDKFSQISQYTKEELLGQNHRMLKSGEHDDAFYERMWTTLTSGKSWHGEIANRRKDGDLYWVASTIVPLLDEHGLPKQYISIRTDITQQKRTEQQLDLYQRHLEQTIERYRESQTKLAHAQAREISFGSQIQRSLLFGDLPARAGSVEIAASTEPSKGIDGDFYDFFSYSADRFDIAIGDVMGKGIPAALIGAAVKQALNRVIAEQAALRTYESEAASPAELINGLHHKIGQRLITLDTFVTLAYLRFDMTLNRVTLVDAGHTRAILTGHDGLRHLSGDNLPLGVLADERYTEHSADIQSGDLVFLYSDGLTEAKNPAGEEFGLERLDQLVDGLHRQGLPAPTLVQGVRKAVRNFEGEVALSDDRTCIALGYAPQGSDRNALDIDLPWRLDGLAPIREAIAAAAKQAGVADDARDALILAAFEAATNVVRHAESPLPDASIHCRIEEADDSLVLSLYYLGEHFAPAETTPDFSGDSEGGFGLYIIRNSVDEAVYDSPAPGVCRVHLRKQKAPTQNG